MKRIGREEEEEVTYFHLFTFKSYCRTNQPLVDSAVLMLELPWRRAPTFGLFNDLRTYRLSLLTHRP